MSAYGYEQTLDRSRREVRFPLESGRECRHIREPRVLGPVTARNPTSQTRSLGVSENVVRRFLDAEPFLMPD